MENEVDLNNNNISDLGSEASPIPLESLQITVNQTATIQLFNDASVILSEKFIYYKSKQSVRVNLHKNLIKFFNLKNPNQEIDPETTKPELVFNISDIAGSSICKGHNKSDNKSYLTIYSYLRSKNKPSETKRKRFVVELACSTSENYEDNFLIISKWQKQISSLIKVSLNESNEFVKPFLVFVNPKAGAGKAKNIYNERVTPIWSEANQPDTVVYTGELIL